MTYPSFSIQGKSMQLLLEVYNTPTPISIFAAHLDQDRKTVDNALRGPFTKGELKRVRRDNVWCYYLSDSMLQTLTNGAPKLKTPIRKPIKSTAGKQRMKPLEPAIDAHLKQGSSAMDAREASSTAIKQASASTTPVVTVIETPEEAKGFSVAWDSVDGISFTKDGVKTTLEGKELKEILKLYIHMKGGLPELDVVDA